MAGYVRQSASDIQAGLIVKSAIFNKEFDALASAFGTSGHTHNGTAGNGPKLDINQSTTGVLPQARLGLPTDIVYGSNTVDSSPTLKFAVWGTDGKLKSSDSFIQMIGDGDEAVAAYAIKRENHTGTQPISSVVNLQSTLDGKLNLTGGDMTGILNIRRANSHIRLYGDTKNIGYYTTDGVFQGSTYVTPTDNRFIVNMKTSTGGDVYFSFRDDGDLVLPNNTPVDDRAAASKKFVNDGLAGKINTGDADKTTLQTVTSAMSQAPLGGDIDESNDRFFLLVNSAPSKRYGWGNIRNWIKSWITKSDVGLSNVDNTSDANKPVSTAQQNALNAKQNNLGFTPVEQGGFAGVGSNKIRIGWGTGAVLRLRVDAADYGQNWPIDIRGTANNADNFGSMSVQTWQDFIRSQWPGVSWSDQMAEANFPVGHTILAGGNFSQGPNITTPPRLASGSGASGYVSDSTSGASGRLNGTWKTRGGAGSAMLYQRVG